MAFFGEKNWEEKAYINQADIINRVNGYFPSTYITDGNVFSFMDHGVSLNEKLVSQGVDSVTFFPN